ncbi:MAG TPA: chloride channel protein [Caulobacteraceae bacterium]|nr:chloride channel protein [Caulobacteraceae bacterium]
MTLQPSSEAGQTLNLPGRAAGTMARRLRGLVRRSELVLIVMAIVLGVAAGLAVALLGTLSSALHVLLFGVGAEHVSGVAKLPRGYAAPIAGGLILGVGAWLWRSRRPTTPVDPIEANALHGGRMSLRDSLWVTAQTLVSNGFGASVGLEGGYAQVGSGFASKLGVLLRLRRNDLRVFVGCGAGAAIGAAFGAPLTGAFYAFELIIGTYTVATVGAVLAASLAGVVTARAVRATTYDLHMPAVGSLHVADYPSMIVLGLVCALLGVTLMRATSLAENLLNTVRAPRPIRPALGGCVMTALALMTPQVLASGHGALGVDIAARLSIWALVLLIALKMLASTVSLGSGFRGGLFFASLFLGALVGKLFATAAEAFAPQLGIDPTICILVGMSSFAVAVIGGPLTMSFLVLETTGDFAVTTVVLAAAIITSIVVRETFGYSFSTWRLHVRGETIRSAIDVGWMRTLTVGRMMRRDPSTIPADASLAELRRRYPLGSTQRVVVVDAEGRYEGMVLTAEAYASADRPEEDAKRTAHDIARWGESPLTPAMNIKQAVAIFDRTESEALAVVEDLVDRKVIGLLTEGYALRRYADELDMARQGLGGDA